MSVKQVVQYHTSDGSVFTTSHAAEAHEVMYQIAESVKLSLYEHCSVRSVLDLLLAKYDLTPKRGPR